MSDNIVGVKNRVKKEMLIIDHEKSKRNFSLRGYLLKGLMAFILIGGIFYFSFGKTRFAIGGSKVQQNWTIRALDINWVN